jgi:hypothetical protein
MKWVEANGLKMDYIRRFTEEFVTNSEIQRIIFNAIGITNNDDQKYFMDQFIEKINIVFRKQIAEYMKAEALRSQDEYNRYLKTYTPYITQNIERQQLWGNLTGNLISNKTGGESNA